MTNGESSKRSGMWVAKNQGIAIEGSFAFCEVVNPDVRRIFNNVNYRKLIFRSFLVFTALHVAFVVTLLFRHLLG